MTKSDDRWSLPGVPRIEPHDVPSAAEFDAAKEGAVRSYKDAERFVRSTFERWELALTATPGELDKGRAVIGEAEIPLPEFSAKSFPLVQALRHFARFLISRQDIREADYRTNFMLTGNGYHCVPLSESAAKIINEALEACPRRLELGGWFVYKDMPGGKYSFYQPTGFAMSAFALMSVPEKPAKKRARYVYPFPQLAVLLWTILSWPPRVPCPVHLSRCRRDDCNNPILKWQGRSGKKRTLCIRHRPHRRRVADNLRRFRRDQQPQ